MHSASEGFLAQPSRIFPPLASIFGCKKGECLISEKVFSNKMELKSEGLGSGRQVMQECVGKVTAKE